MNSVDFTIIPAAGLGTRWKPFSLFFPKEMLPFNGKPVIEHIIREVIESGCINVILVINKDKEVIKEFIESQKELKRNVNFYFVYQKKPLGVSDAILSAKKFVQKQNFALVFPDMPSIYQYSPLGQVIKTFKNLPKGSHLLSFAKYPQNNMLFYGEYMLKKRSDNLYNIIHLCPRAKNVFDKHHPRSSLRGAGRHIFSSNIFPLIEEVLRNIKGREVWDGDFQELAINRGQKLFGVEISGFVFDIGTPEGYEHANYLLEKKKIST